MTRWELGQWMRKKHTLASLVVQADGHGGREATVTCVCGARFFSSGNGGKDFDTVLVDRCLDAFAHYHNRKWLRLWKRLPAVYKS